MPEKRDAAADMTRDELLAPVMGAILTNAFYTAELLHAQKGVNPSREDIHHEVMKAWLDITAKIVKVTRTDYRQ
ncbi:MAG TPA: hypothetical protein VNX25_10540 [Verrucomicrobiae bacterium]|nr:hypothetical protein [Verrucomicrobiae bacterium]